MIHFSPPHQFNPTFTVVGVFLEHGGEFVLLLRQDHKPEGNTWCLPAGKVGTDERTEAAACREVFEETGVKVDEDQLEFIKEVYVVFPTYDFIYRTYRYQMSGDRPSIVIAPDEHKEFAWVTPPRALGMNLIQDEAPCIQFTYAL